jgi:hypothetical protein
LAIGAVNIWKLPRIGRTPIISSLVTGFRGLTANGNLSI